MPDAGALPGASSTPPLDRTPVADRAGAVRPGAVRPGVIRAGLAVMADAGRLLAAHWPTLLLLAAAGVVARDLLLAAAVVASRTSPLLSQLVLALAPFAQVVTVVAMLLVLRSRAAAPGTAVAVPRHRAGLSFARGSWPRVSLPPVPGAVMSLFAATATVLLPYLVVYEHYGNLAEDVVAVGMGTAEDVIASGLDVGPRLPGSAPTTVLVTVIVALAARSLLGLLVRRTPAEHVGLRSALRLAVGYCEVVWIVLGAYVVTRVLDGFGGWWAERRVAVGIDALWAGLAISWPSLTGGVETALAVAGLLLAAALTSFLVPLAWLEVTAIIYGVQAASVLRAGDLSGGRWGGATVGRLGDARTERAMSLLMDPDRRFGTVVGAGALILRAGWRPVLVFCLAYLAADNADLVVWQAARWVVGPQTHLLWAGLVPVLDAVGSILVRVLTLALVAAAVDSLLRDLGLPGALRLPSRRRVDG